MKVSLIHPERRTQQSIALDGAHLPKRLGPTQRHELTLERGKFIDFTASTNGKKHYGPVQLDIEIEAEEGETLKPGMVTVSPVAAKNESPSLEVNEVLNVSDDERRGSAWFTLQPGAAQLIVIANPAETAAAPDAIAEDSRNG